MADKILTAADSKKIKQALYDLAESEAYVILLERVGMDVSDIKALRENAKNNLIAYQEFIENQK